MARIEVRMPSAEGLAAGQTATFKLPIGRRYHEMQLDYVATGAGAAFAVSDISEIRIFANGKVIHRYSGADRDKMNQFDGRSAATISATAGRLVIPFDRFNLKTLAGQEESALNTGIDSPPMPGASYITSLYMEVDVAATAVGSLSMNMNATQSDRLAGGAGTIIHIQKHTRDPAGAGEFEISDLPRGTQTSQALNRIFFKPSANDISDVVIERNLYKIFERSKALNEYVQKDGVRTPQSGFIVIDKTERGIGGDPIALVGATDFRYRLTMTGAASLVIYSEYIGGLGD